MKRSKENRLILVGDFETTVYEGQTYTEVWASALVETGMEDVHILHSIEETWEYLKSLKRSMIVYYHNLKFDGTFWLDFLIRQEDLTQAYQFDGKNYVWLDQKEMPVNSYKYTISYMGQWYSILIKLPRFTIEIRDSLKLLPFSVKKIGESFATKHKKLDMVYEGYRYAGCEITDEEKRYIANDVLVVKEALEIMFAEGHSDITIGACCLHEFKNGYDKQDYKMFFPDVSAVELDEKIYGADNVEKYVRKSYRGGWCYAVPEKTRKLYTNGLTADVNSLYPSVMHSMSGNRYPVGLPKFWKGDFIPEQALHESKYFFIRIKTRFRIKPGYLPFIQIKSNLLYNGTESLKTSDYYDKNTHRYYRYYLDVDGVKHDTSVILTLTQTDFYLIKEHYDLFDCEILDGCYFWTEKGLFDAYINKYRELKMKSKGALRTLAKLFLNNLYGKMATSTNSSFYVGKIGKDNSVNFEIQVEHNKKAGYIPIGSAITSYAREFTIRTAQKNYHGADRGFIYADTDSIHCDLNPGELIDVPVHESEFCHWKIESLWDQGWFVRQKTYIEHVTAEDLKPVEKPYYSIRCAGMPEKCKELFLHSVLQDDVSDEDYDYDELEFIKQKRDITDFDTGLVVPGKLLPHRLQGGTVLVDTTYEMR